MKARQNLYLDLDVIISLDQLARTVRRGDRRANKSRIVSDLLREGISRRAAKQVDVVVKPAVDRMARELAALGRNGSIHFEAFMLLAEHMLTVLPPARDTDAAAKAVGRERFRRFIDTLGRRIAEGGTDLTDDTEKEGSS